MVSPYQTHVPCFGGMWGFALASERLSLLSPTEVERRVSSRVTKGLRFYDGPSHQGIFSLPQNLREAIDNEKRIVTEKEPLFIYRP